MNTLFLIISAICFISAYGIHMFGKQNDWCGYMEVPLLSAIPWISGFILAVIPEAIIFDLFWVWTFLINIVAVFTLGPIITRVFLVLVSRGKSAGVDILISLVLGIATLLIGALI